jgi:class 3 adenylate cyclase
MPGTLDSVAYTPRMAACPSCGEANPERARFCLNCGAALSAEGAGERAHETRRRVTVLFADVAGSTNIGEQLDPEALREVMQRYFDAMRVAIERHAGTVEKFIGDAVMAVFGIPQLHEDDPLRAVRAAFDMQKSLERLNRDLRERWGVELAIRTGINTGAARARLLARRGRLSDAERAGREAVAVAEAMDYAELPPAAHFALGDVRRSAGRLDEAKSEWRAAIEELEISGNDLWAGRLRRELAELGESAATTT